MKKYWKYVLLTGGGLLAIVIILIIIIALTINPNGFKPQIVDFVKQKKQRTLILQGDIKMTFFPRLGLDLGQLSVSEHQAKNVFAAMDRARLFVAWLPLLRKELIVYKVTLDGVHANLVRYKDGTTNFDDLLKKEDKSPLIKFDIDGVKITQSSIAFDDRLNGRKANLTRLEMTSGRIKTATPSNIALDFDMLIDQPKMNIHAILKSGLLFDLDKKYYALSGMNLTTKGAAVGLTEVDASLTGDLEASPEALKYVAKNIKLNLRGSLTAAKLNLKLNVPTIQLTQKKMLSEKILFEASIERSDGRIQTSVSVPGMEGTGQSFKASQLIILVEGKQGDTSVKGKLSSPWSASVEMQRFDLNHLQGELNIANAKLPKGSVHLALSGNAHLDIKQQNIALNLTSKLDESNIQAKLGMQQFALPSYSFDINIDQIDLDHYTVSQPVQTRVTKSGSPEQPLDFSILKNLNANGSLRIGSLKFANVKSKNVRMTLKPDSP